MWASSGALSRIVVLKNKREIPGNDLLSHPVARAVPSALVGLTAVFGMGTGVSPPLWSPDISLMTSENASLVHGKRLAVRRRILQRYSSALARLCTVLRRHPWRHPTRR